MSWFGTIRQQAITWINDDPSTLMQKKYITPIKCVNSRIKKALFSGSNWQMSGPLFTEKMQSYGYKNPHHKPKTVWRPSQVYNRNPCTDKTVSS